MTIRDSRPKSIDLTHHLNTLSRSRIPSPLKDIIKYMAEPGIISLAGGLPHPTLFPYHGLRLDAYAPDALTNQEQAARVPLYSAKSEEGAKINISSGLQYSHAKGSERLSSFVREFTEHVLHPGYLDFEILLHSGNTDAWNKVVSLLCEEEDYILVEQHTYPSAQALWAPMGCRGAPVDMDKDGIIPEALERLLERWNEAEMRGKRPKLLYVIPVAQNPTGATMTLERKKAVYDICVKYDVVICEDDPYYFLQLPAYASPEHRVSRPQSEMTSQELVASLVPTFVSLDWQGRVIRLETFSKTLGPGNRLGYFVCNPIFAERLLRATEVMTQSPSGWSQIVIEELLVTWGQQGFLRWLMGLRHSYAVRRDWMCDSLAECFDVVAAPEGALNDVVAYSRNRAKEVRSAPFFSFSYPKGGMFLWIKLDLSQNPAYQRMKANGEANAERKWADEFWVSMIKAKVPLLNLPTPGYPRVDVFYPLGSSSSWVLLHSDPEQRPTNEARAFGGLLSTGVFLRDLYLTNRSNVVAWWSYRNGKNSRAPKPMPPTSDSTNAEANNLRKYIRRLAFTDHEERDRMLNEWVKDDGVNQLVLSAAGAGSRHNSHELGQGASDDEGFESPSTRMDDSEQERARPFKRVRTKVEQRSRSPSADESVDQDDTQWRPESALRLSLKPATPADSESSSIVDDENGGTGRPNQQVSNWVDHYIGQSLRASSEANGPSYENRQTLLSNYFCWQGPRNSIVDQRVFENAMRENDPKYCSQFLLYSIYAHTIRYVPNLAELAHEYT
ncbi:hypothetical protein V5O48_016415, partial [Marasmius crinis-equi]